MKRSIERATRHTVVASVTTALLLVFAGVGLSQVLVKGPQSNDGSSLSTGTATTGHGQGHGNKVQICHMSNSKKKPGHTLWVGPPAAQAHLSHHHGDHTGVCTAQELHPTTTTASTLTSTTASPKAHGKSKSKTKTKPNKGKNK